MAEFDSAEARAAYIEALEAEKTAIAERRPDRVKLIDAELRRVKGAKRSAKSGDDEG